MADTKQAVNPKEETKISYEDLLKKATALESELKSTKDELQIAKSANEEVNKVNTDLSNRVQAIETEARKDKIASIVSAAYEADQANERIDSFLKSSLPVDEIAKIVAPLVAARSNVKQASVSKPAEYKSQVAIKSGAVEEPTAPKIPASWSNYKRMFEGGVQ